MLISKRKKLFQMFSEEKSRATLMLTLLFYYLCNARAYADTSSSGTATGGANKISNSPFGKGLINMINDASTYLLVLSPLVGGAFGLYFLMRKNAADDQDQKKWNNRLINTGICTVGAVLVTGIISLVTSYFQQTA